MKFTLSSVSAALLTAVATAVKLPYKTFTLHTADGNAVRTYNNEVFIGNTSTVLSYPILTLQTNPGSGIVSYTASDETPTGFQYLYIIEDDVQPIGMTSPHSGAMPENANMTGFAESDLGPFLTFGGKPSFAVAPGEEKVYWAGLGHSRYMQTLLYIKEA